MPKVCFPAAGPREPLIAPKPGLDLLASKVVLVTGATRGIGAACARRLADAGAAVVLADVRPEGAVLCREIEALGRRALFVVCDVRDEAAQRDLFARADATFGRLDAVVANAGINGTRAPIDRFSLEGFDELMAVNLRGTFLTARHAVPLLKRQGGSLILMGSVNGTRTFHHAGSSVYCAAKAAVAALARSLATELGRYGIRVNTIAPGHIHTSIDETLRCIDTDAIDAGIRFAHDSPALRGGRADPEEVADVCLFLVSDLSRHLSGVELFVDGGQSLFA